MNSESPDATEREIEERLLNAKLKFPRVVGEDTCGCPLVGLGIFNRVFKMEVIHTADCQTKRDMAKN